MKHSTHICTLFKVDFRTKKFLDPAFAADPTSPAKARHVPKTPRGPRPVPPPPRNTRQRRLATYKKAQDLYQKDPTSLAEKVILGRTITEESTFPPIHDVEELYSNIFEAISPPATQQTPIEDNTCPKDNIYVPITEDEIAEAKKTWSNSAPGPDGIIVLQVKNCPALPLEVLLNVLLLRRHTPHLWLISRTILILKDGNREDPSN